MKQALLLFSRTLVDFEIFRKSVWFEILRTNFLGLFGLIKKAGPPSQRVALANLRRD
jgi:hypothetical protein